MTELDAPDNQHQLAKRRMTPARIGLCFGYAVVIVYLLVPLILWSPTYANLVLYPYPASKNPECYAQIMASAGKSVEERQIDDGHGHKLHALYFTAKAPTDKLLIYHHGNAGNIATRGSIYPELLNSGVNLLVYDYNGFGKSGGTASLGALIDDGMSVFDYAQNELHYQPKNIINYGESIGSGVACAVAQQRGGGALVLESAISSIPRVAKEKLDLLDAYPDFIFPAPHFDNVAAIENIHCPLLMMHGGKDVLIPVQHAQLVFQHAHEPKRFITLHDSGHNGIGSAQDVAAFQEALRSLVASI